MKCMFDSFVDVPTSANIPSPPTLITPSNSCRDIVCRRERAWLALSVVITCIGGRIRISSKITRYRLEEIQLDDEQEDYASIKP